MAQSRQAAFQKLRPACVDLSSVALKFKADQIPVKNVLHALERLLQILRELGQHGWLDEKLAEYAFFPLSHVFNEAQRLSSGCLEAAVQCVTVLVAQAWRHLLKPEMGKQLLILMSIIAGGGASNTNISTSEELKTVCCECIAVLAAHMRSDTPDQQPWSEPAARSIIDRLFYMLLDMVAESEADTVQYSATQSMLAILKGISHVALVASLLPRTVSCVVKVLQPNTKARRPSKVLVAYLELLGTILSNVLADTVLSSIWEEKALTTSTGLKGEDPQTEGLDASWLKATAPQVKTALFRVSRLRYHENAAVRQALLQLCLCLIRECQRSLADALPVMVEIVASISFGDGQTELRARSELKDLVTVYPTLAIMLNEKLYEWSTALPRILQSSDDRPKQHMLAQYSASFIALSETMQLSPQTAGMLASALINSIASALDKPVTTMPMLKEIDNVQAPNGIVAYGFDSQPAFAPFVLNQAGEQSSMLLMEGFLQSLRDSPVAANVSRSIVDAVETAEGNRKLATLWLALKLLQPPAGQQLQMEDFLSFESAGSDANFDRAYLVSDLYGTTVSNIIAYSDDRPDSEIEWHLCALSLEVLILQSMQLGESYRPELIDTLYPVLSLMGSRNDVLRRHALTALNLLARACQYSSVQDLLVDNVDYLVNSIAMKLNAFDLSPQGPRVLLMMVRLCGIKLLPYLDDLIASIFTALDMYHGYPRLVEVLFEVLKVIVDEATKAPFTIEGAATSRRNERLSPSSISDILQDLEQRSRRKRQQSIETEDDLSPAPHRPWSKKMGSGEDGASVEPRVDDEIEERDDAASHTSNEPKEDKDQISKSHQLLLNITQATAPHLTSPSIQVRHTLLQLIAQICPLLALHENTFLPLINLLWPGVAARLFSAHDDRAGTIDDGDTVYNICSAADVASTFCKQAGDFMSTRVEAIFEQLGRSFEHSYDSVYTRRVRKKADVSERLRPQDFVATRPVNLPIMRANISLQAGSERAEKVPILRNVRSAHGKLLNAFSGLLVSIVQHVRVSDDHGDRILEMLGPIMNEEGNEYVKEALSAWNPDPTWLFDHIQTSVSDKDMG